MPKVSQYQLDDKRMRELIGQLWNGFTLLEDRAEVKKFLSKFFSPTEIQMFAKRLELLKLANSDLEVTQLQKLTGVSRVTVYEWLNRHDGFEADFRSVIDKLKDLDKDYLEQLKARIEHDIRMPKRTTAGSELIKLGVTTAYKGYKKRKKRQSVVSSVV